MKGSQLLMSKFLTDGVENGLLTPDQKLERQNEDILNDYFNESTSPDPIKPDFVVDFNESILHTGSILCFLITKDSKRLISAGEDKYIKVWDINTLQIMGTLKGSNQEVRFLALNRKNPEILFSGGAEEIIRIWNLTTYSQIGILNIKKNVSGGLAFTFDHKLIYGWDTELFIWDTENLSNISIGTNRKICFI